MAFAISGLSIHGTRTYSRDRQNPLILLLLQFFFRISRVCTKDLLYIRGFFGEKKNKLLIICLIKVYQVICEKNWAIRKCPAAVFLRASFSSWEQKARKGRKKAIARMYVCVYIYIHNREIRCPWKRQAAYRRTRLHREIACAGDQIIVGAFSLIRFPATSHKRPPAFTFACALAFTSRLGFARNHARSLIREHLKEIKSLVEEKSDLHDRKWLFEKKDVKLSRYKSIFYYNHLFRYNQKEVLESY